MRQVESKKAKGKNRGIRVGLHVLCGGAFYFLLFTFYFLVLPSAAAAQDDDDLAPPPLKLISKAERSRLDAETDPKDRTKLALELMNARLLIAEKLNNGKDFDGMYRELGGFHALMDNGLDYLLTLNSNKGKVLDNLKRIEIGLRGFSPRLESIRRELPLRYDDYVRRLVKYVREARTRASEPLFADTVVPVKSPD